MTLKPRLSICVPSRNRQKYFKKTIEALMRSLRTDVEFVFADNSDVAETMNAYMVDVQKDPRVVYLPSTGQTLSMVDNWERTMAASTGDWIIFIGDDDYVDPESVRFIARMEEAIPNLDAISWGVVHYLWPHGEPPTVNLFVPFKSDVMVVPRAVALARMYGWQDATTVPTSGFSIYHSPISRRLMEKIKTLYGGRYFEHPTVDYDNAMKVISTGENFAFCQRSFGVMGVCPESNSFAIGRLDDLKKKMAKFMEDVGRDIDEDDYMANFPFKSVLGVTACIAQVQHWFKLRYKLSYTGWEKHFVAACARNVESFSDPEAFEIVAEGYRSAIASWENGRYLKYFEPKISDPKSVFKASGATNDGIYLDYGIAGITTPGEYYDIVNDISAPIDLIDMNLKDMIKIVPVSATDKRRGQRR